MLWWQEPLKFLWEEIAELTYFGRGSLTEGTLRIRSRGGEGCRIGALYMHGMPRLREQLKKHVPGQLARLLEIPGFERAVPAFKP